MSDNHIEKRTWLGLLILLFGAVLLLDNLGIFFFEFYIPSYLFSWKTLLIIIGAAMIASKRAGGLILVFIGGFFLIPDIFYIPSNYLRDWWPILLIAIGVAILLRNTTKRANKDKTTRETNKLDDFSILGGAEKIITSTVFQGGSSTAILGGSQLDLTEAQLAPGMQTIDVLYFMGGSTLIVPSDWNVKIDVINILGGFTDKRRPDDIDEEKILLIKGFAILGGGEIRNR
jgi:predicted membrane protein